jgi:hypothetical protein
MINIEGNFDFYSELKKQLNSNIGKHDVVDNLEVNNTSDGKCLITNENLTNGYVTLLCNHSFNYIPLYNDLVNHKKSLSLETQYLKTNEIRCPYCRNKQSVLIPYYDMVGVKKTIGVNYIKKAGTFVGKCNYNDLIKDLYLKEYCIDVINNIILDGSHKVLCPNTVSTLSEDGNWYCSNHKIKAKSLIHKNKKYEEKMKLMKEKEDKKHKKINSENVVMDLDLCSIILVSGKNKGTQCSTKKYNNEMCKRHYNLHIKKDVFKFLDDDVDNNVDNVDNDNDNNE